MYAKRAAILRYALDNAEQKASEAIGTQVKIGNAVLEEWSLSKLTDSALILDNLEIFDNTYLCKSNSIHISNVSAADFDLKHVSVSLYASTGISYKSNNHVII